MLFEATQFKDAEFMSAEEKKKVFKDWKRFIANGFKRQHFTKRLYEHLHLHCSFIAHYDINGFYSTYFNQPEDKMRFLEHFDKLGKYIVTGDYSDINQAMIGELEKLKDYFAERFNSEEKENDIAEIKSLMRKWGIEKIELEEGEKAYVHEV